MVVANKSKLFSLIILVVTLTGLILILSTDFAGVNLIGHYSRYRYSFFMGMYNIPANLITMIVVILSFIAQIILSLSDILPNKFLLEEVATLGLLCAGLTLLFIIMDGIEFVIQYSEYEWWLKTGFYAGTIISVVNAVLFFLKTKIK